MHAQGVPEEYSLLSHVHGALCAIAVVLIFPTGAILLRVLKWHPVTFHQWTQLLGFGIYLAGFIASIVLWAHLEDGFEWTAGPHGQLGLAVSGCVLVQVVLGIWNHRSYRVRLNRSDQVQEADSLPKSPLSWVHILLGWFIVVVGVVNGALGQYGVQTWCSPRL